MKRLTTLEFIEKAQCVHENKYDYSLVDYETARGKVTILCLEHGPFQQIAQNHLFGNGCPVCGVKRNGLFNSDEFIDKAKDVHGDLYSYENCFYKCCRASVTIRCFSHGEFTQKAANHLQGQGCPVCAKKKRLISLDILIKKFNEIYNYYYDYSLVDYRGRLRQIKIICPLHGIFETTPDYHLRNVGCSQCRPKSKPERKIAELLSKNFVLFKQQKTYEDLRGISGKLLQFDFYLPLSNTIIEYDGEQHFKPIEIWGGEEELKNTQARDSIKNKYCFDNDIKLIRIAYYENIESKLKENGIIN